MVLILIFGEVLGLYGYVTAPSTSRISELYADTDRLIVSLILNTRASG